MSALTKVLDDMLTIPTLKRAARKHYLAYQKATADMSCGKALAEHISGSAASHKAAFNSIMDKISRIDPDCPKSRL